MKTEKFYSDKIKLAEQDIIKYHNRIVELKHPKPLKPSKDKTKIISFRVPCNRADELKYKVTEFLMTFI